MRSKCRHTDLLSCHSPSWEVADPRSVRRTSAPASRTAVVASFGPFETLDPWNPSVSSKYVPQHCKWRAPPVLPLNLSALALAVRRRLPVDWRPFFAAAVPINLFGTRIPHQLSARKRGAHASSSDGVTQLTLRHRGRAAHLYRLTPRLVAATSSRRRLRMPKRRRCALTGSVTCALSSPKSDWG